MIKKIKFVYITNELTHLISQLIDYFNNCDLIDFQFILCDEISEERLNLGCSDYSKNYSNIIRVNDFDDEYIIDLCYNADVMILGQADIKYVKRRLEEDKLTFRFSERLFKKGFLSFLKQKYMPHENNKIFKYRNNENFYILGASYYAPFDFVKLGLKKEKQLKWGYFPPFEELNINEILENKSKDVLNLLWCGRYLVLKHPEFAINAIKFLLDNNVNCHLDLIGVGPEKENIKNLIEKYNLLNYISLCDSLPNEKLRNKMKDTHIYLFTSDRKEGWGAVLNEAMSLGCCSIASSAAGSTNYLIKDGYNGLIYDYPNQKQLNKKLLSIAKDKELREKLTINAYNTMRNLWNGKIAAERLVSFSKYILEGKTYFYDDGPCSLAFKNKY